MRMIRSVLPAMVSGAAFVAMAATGELRAEGEGTNPEVKPGAGAAPQADDADAMKAMVNEIKKHATLCSEAQLRMDFEKVLPYVPKKVLEMMGGPQVLKTRLAQGDAVLKTRGVSIDSAVIGEPEVPQKHGGVLASLVPMTTRMTTPQGKLVATSHMIAISEDGGKSWVFVDTATVNEEKLGTLYPVLKGKVKIPPATAKMEK